MAACHLMYDIDVENHADEAKIKTKETSRRKALLNYPGTLELSRCS